MNKVIQRMGLCVVTLGIMPSLWIKEVYVTDNHIQQTK